MPQSWTGKTIGGRYQVESLLGQGGMSAVYLATDPNLRRKVAIKLIHAHLSEDPNFVSRFKEEAAAVARLRHPNIVQVHDFDSDGDAYYMVMEHLVGETLQARLQRLNAAQRYMPYPELLGYFSQVCDAVGYAHRHELIHRDIKPANVMLDLNAQAILMDFGIVKIVGGQHHTATGATVGTAKYMSPEQIRSEKVDERSDIYSLGVTLYEMISGRTPYEADSVLTLIMMVLNDPLPDIREIRRGVPESLASVVEKALEKESLARFATTDEMANALTEALSDTTPDAAATVVDEVQPAQAMAQGLPDGQPQKVETASTESVSVEAAQPEAQPGELAPPDQPAIAQRQVAATTLKDTPLEAASAPKQGTLFKAWEAVRRTNRRLVIWAAVALILVAGTIIGMNFAASKSLPELQTARVSEPSAALNEQTVKSVVSLGLWETDSFIEELAFSPDGMHIGTANNRDTMRFSKYRYYGALWRLDTAGLQSYQLGHTGWVNGIAFSPDGLKFASASDDDTIMIWRTSDGGMVIKIEASLGGITSLDISPSNLLLATGSWDGSVALWQMSDGHLLRILEGHQDSVRDVKFSPDGRMLASSSDDRAIRLWQVSDGSLLRTLGGHAASVRELAFSPDGARLASVSEDHSIRIWQVSGGNLLSSLEGHSATVLDVAFSTDGSLLATGAEDGTLILWLASSGEMLRTLTEHSDSITGVAFSPDGHMLVSAAADGVLQFWGLSDAIPLESETS